MPDVLQLDEINILKFSTDLQCALITKLAFAEEVLYLTFKKKENAPVNSIKENFEVACNNIQKSLYKKNLRQLLEKQKPRIMKIFDTDFPSAQSNDGGDRLKTIRRKMSEALLFDLLQDIVEHVHEILKASACSIYLKTSKRDEMNRFQAELRAGTSHHKENIGERYYPFIPFEEVDDNVSEENKKLGITGWVISKGRSFLSRNMEDIKNHKHHTARDVPENKKLAAMLAVPIATPRGEILGVIKAEGLEDDNKQFDVPHQMLLETIAAVAGRCKVHQEDFEAGNINTAISGWLNDVISEAVAFEEELDNFLDIVVRVISAASLADSCAIFLIDESVFIDESDRTLTQRAGSGNQVLKKVIRSYRLPKHKLESNISNLKIPESEKIGLTPWIANTGQSFYAGNYDELSKHPYHKGKFDEENYESERQCGAWFGVPLKVGGVTKGVLKIENESKKKVDDLRDFRQEIQNRVDLLTQTAALSVERFQSRVTARNKIFDDAGIVIFEILSGNLKVKEIVTKVVETTKKLLNAQACALFLKEGNQLIQPKWAAGGWAQKGVNVRIYQLVDQKKIVDKPTSVDEKVGLTVWIAQKREKFIAKSNLELTMHPHHKGTFDKVNFEKDQKCESFMGYPLEVGEEVIGVLKVETKKRAAEKDFTYFSEQDELVFKFIANSAAIAIHNARIVELNELCNNLEPYDNDNHVVEELYKFIKIRQAVVTTLTQAAEQYKSDSMGKIIRIFLSLLYPNFEVSNFEALKNSVTGKLKIWAQFFLSALNVKNPDEINDFSDKDEGIRNLIYSNFFLNTSLEILLKTKEEIANKLKNTDGKSKQKLLLECNKIIDKKIREIEEMNLFESCILERIFSHWKMILEKSLAQKNILKELEINCVDFFGNFTWTFEPQINILLGKNGYGKTHLIRLIAALVKNNTEIACKFFVKSKEESYAKLTVELDDIIKEFEYKKSGFGKDSEEIPILAISDARFVNKSQPAISYIPEEGIEEGPRKTGAYHFLYQKPFEAVIQNFLYQLCIDYYDKEKSFNAPKFKLLKDIVRQLTDSSFDFHSVHQIGNAIMIMKIITEGNEEHPLPIQVASQGTLSVLAIFGLIYDFLQSVYLETTKNLLEEYAIVLIDEIDAHLHPSWQRRIVGLLRKYFPKIQFILTAHSPLVVAGCLEGEVSVLKKTEDGLFSIYQYYHDFIGWDPVDIYNKVLDIKDIDESYMYYNALFPFISDMQAEIDELETKAERTKEDDARLEDLYEKIRYAEIANKKLVERFNLESLKYDKEKLQQEIKRLQRDSKS